MDIITTLVVGLVAGLLASAVVRGSGLGIVGDIVLGIAGAFVGAWAFHELGWKTPFAGLPGVIAVATVGAVLVLLIIRLFRAVTSSARTR
jgi:uncharacterized membrane protein YeaQ/YmgE (transglycosylase-associated protein family)